MQTAACYIRVSTDDQLEFSPDAQKRALMEYAGKNGMLVNEEYVFIDEGISGRKAEKRPAFMKMISTAKLNPRPFDVILVHKFDRFARNREDSVVYKSLLRKECGVQVVSVTERVEDDKFSVILEAMLEAMAEYYSLNLSDEVKKGMTEKARRGGILSQAPYGYANRAGRAPAVVAEEAEVVRYMFEKVRGGEMTPFTLARALNGSGLFTRNGRAWGVNTVKYILSNAFYAGVSVWNKQDGKTMKYKDRSEWITAAGAHEPLISREDFLEVQSILAAGKRRRERPAEQHCHWLSGLVKCSGCGASLSVAGRDHYPYFQCHRYNKGQCEQSHYVPVPTMEEAVIAALQALTAQSPGAARYRARQPAAGPAASNLPLLHAGLKKAREKLSRVKSAFAAGVDTLEEYKENKQSILNEIGRIQREMEKSASASGETRELSETREGIAGLLAVLCDENRADAEKNAVLKSIVRRIVFVKRTRTIEVFFYYD